MSAPLKAFDGNADLPELMTDLAERARKAARVLALASPEQKNRALEAIERAIRANAAAILAANAEDVAEVRAGGATSAFIDRLTLTQSRIDAMADGVATVRAIKDPVGVVTESWKRPNGMTIERVRVPLGVVAVIFESRPNVAADAGVLCLKSGNAVILRGGSDSFRSCRAIHDCLVRGLREAGLPEASITLVPTRDRAAVGLLLTGLNGAIDLIVPRGGKSLVARVEAEARVRCSRILKASITSTSITPPIWRWRNRSYSTPRCAVPASAAQPRPCWSIATARRRHSRPWSRC